MQSLFRHRQTTVHRATSRGYGSGYFLSLMRRRGDFWPFLGVADGPLSPLLLPLLVCNRLWRRSSPFLPYPNGTVKHFVGVSSMTPARGRLSMSSFLSHPPSRLAVERPPHPFLL